LRGYCIAERDGKVIRSAGGLKTGDRIRLRMSGGGADARVEEVYHDKKV
jgi:exonuclease VII large subunit